MFMYNISWKGTIVRREVHSETASFVVLLETNYKGIRHREKKRGDWFSTFTEAKDVLIERCTKELEHARDRLVHAEEALRRATDAADQG
jgi:hypothetical protein